MNPFFAHIGSGGSFYTGLLLIVAGMAVECLSDGNTWWTITSRISIVTGVAGVGLSSVPQPWWLLLMWLIGFITWRVAQNSDWISRRIPPTVARILFLFITCLVLALELPYRQNPPTLSKQPASILVVGDSLTAGTYRLSESRRWPQVFARQYTSDIETVARAGWTISQALDGIRQREIPTSTDAILLLIGGNDVMLGTPTSTFRRDLDRLLKLVTRANVPVYMVEIPLPPFGYEYGRIQRRLVGKHGVRLIPKYHVMSIMSGSERTLDGIHLSKRGHQLMARRIHDLLLGN